jgi:hypothetical protein
MRTLTTLVQSVESLRERSDRALRKCQQKIDGHLHSEKKELKRLKEQLAKERDRSLKELSPEEFTKAKEPDA